MTSKHTALRALPASPAAISPHDAGPESPLDEPRTVFGRRTSVARRVWSALIALAFLLTAVLAQAAKRRGERRIDVPIDATALP